MLTAELQTTKLRADANSWATDNKATEYGPMLGNRLQGYGQMLKAGLQTIRLRANANGWATDYKATG